MELGAKPDFVVAGGQYDGYVVLIASKTLKHIELKEVSPEPEFFGYFGERRYMLPPIPKIILTAIFKDYVVVRAENYPEAWKALFEMWSPNQSEQKAITEPQRAIEPPVHYCDIEEWADPCADEWDTDDD